MKYCVILWILLLLNVNYSYAESTLELLEKGIYYEESLGDLNSAIEVYQKISQDAQVKHPHVAEALFRQGMLQKTLGNSTEAAKSLKQLIEYYPNQEHFVTKASSALSEMTLPIVQLQPAPWLQNEMAVYKLTVSSGGESIGYSTFAIKESENDQVWHIESSMIGFVNQSHNIVKVEVNKANFQPIAGSLRTTNGLNMDFIFDGNNLKTTQIDQTGKPNIKVINQETTAFGQLPYLIRRLDLTETLDLQLPIFDEITSLIGSVQVRSKGKKTVTVDAGVFECWVISAQLKEGNLVQREYTFFIADDDTKTLVKTEGNGGTLSLVEKSVVSTSPKLYSSTKPKVSFQYPGDSALFDISHLDPSMKKLLLITDTESIYSTMFAVKKAPKDRLKKIKIKKIVNGDLKLLKNIFEGYSVREGSRKLYLLDSRPTNSFIADFHFNKQKLVEYRTYIKGEQHIYWFILRSPTDEFERQKTAFEEVFKSIKFN